MRPRKTIHENGTKQKLHNPWAVRSPLSLCFVRFRGSLEDQLPGFAFISSHSEVPRQVPTEALQEIFQPTHQALLPGPINNVGETRQQRLKEIDSLGARVVEVLPHVPVVSHPSRARPRGARWSAARKVRRRPWLRPRDSLGAWCWVSSILLFTFFGEMSV